MNRIARASTRIYSGEYPTVTVIVLNYNGSRFLKDCFSSLRLVDYPKDRLELLMVDNGSVDNSISVISGGFPEVRVVSLSANEGFSRGNNIGADAASGEYVVFLNNDTVVEKEWLKELVLGVAGRDGLIANSKVIYDHDKDILNIGRGFINWWGVGFCKGAGERHDIFGEPISVHHATGASMIVRKKDFKEIGGFDEDFFAYHEDIDFGWRAWIYGYSIEYVPTSVVYHRSGSTSGAFSPSKTYLISRNTLAYILKNCQMPYMVIMLIVNILFLIGVAAFFLFPIKLLPIRYRNSVKISGAIMRGIGAFFKHIALTIRKRRTIQTRRIVGDRALMQKGLIMPLGESALYLVKNSFRMLKPLIRSNALKDEARHER